MYKPIMEQWGLDIKAEIMDVDLNSHKNPELFQTQATNRIFDRFPINFTFNRLPPRFYYVGTCEMQRMQLNIQGQTSLLFINDFTDMYDRITDYLDVSNSFDERMKRLPMLGAFWDKIRTMKRGSLMIKFKEFQIDVWSKRTFNRYDDKLSISFSDFQYNKKVIINPNQKH